MEEYEKELKVGSKDDMLAHAENHVDKTLTLKSLQKAVRIKFNELKKQLELVKHELEVVKKCLKR